MILTPRGYIRFEPAAALLDASATHAYMKGGELYELSAVRLIGVNQVRIAGNKVQGAQFTRHALAVLKVAATEVIPAIRAPEWLEEQ